MVDPSGLFSLGSMMTTLGISGKLRSLNWGAQYAAKQFVWASIETGTEVIIGQLISAATGIRFDSSTYEIGRALGTNFVANLATSGIRKMDLLRQILDFAIRTVSDITFGGQDIWWAAGMNLVSLGVSELLANYGAKLLGECIKKYGPCFVAGTPLVIGFDEVPARTDHPSANDASVTNERKTITKAIENIELGSRIVTERPEYLPQDNEFEEPKQATWRLITLLQRRADGTEVHSELLRPIWWIDLLGLKVGQAVDVHFSELETNATARILSISACPPVEDGDGRVVIARHVTHCVSNLLRVTLENSDELTGTASHPLWSIDALAWKRIDELQPGERLLTLSGETRVASVDVVSHPADVFNIEVHADHIYRLLPLGILAHNADCAGQIGKLWYALPGAERAAKLTADLKDTLRTEARWIMAEKFGLPYDFNWLDVDSCVHHIIPLEWAHLFPSVSPNNNLRIAVMRTDDHKMVTEAWEQWNKLHPDPDASMVYEQARKIQGQFGHLFSFAPGTNVSGIWDY